MDKYEGGGAIFSLRAEEDVQKERMRLSPHHQSAYCLQTSGGLVQEDGYRRASKVNRSIAGVVLHRRRDIRSLPHSSSICIR